MHKIIPAVNDSQIAVSPLDLRLAHEIKLAAIVQLPNNAVTRKDSAVR